MHGVSGVKKQGSLCRCLESKEARELSSEGRPHVHCLCALCEGKACYPMTAWRHLQRLEMCRNEDVADVSIPSNSSSEEFDSYESGISNVEPSEVCEASHCYQEFSCNSASALAGIPRSDSDSENDMSSDDNSTPSRLSEDEGSDFEREDSVLERGQPMDQFVYDAILRLVEIKGEAGFSQSIFQNLLDWGQGIISKDNVQLRSMWPSSWAEVLVLLETFGYKTPRLFWICLNDSHPCLFGLLTSKEQPCPHCGQQGSIPYYYLSVADKVKRWCASPSMCRKMTAHWEEKSHWLPTHQQEGWGYAPKKEFWDGARFAQLSYFWNPDSEWIIPVKCPQSGCGYITSAEKLLACPVLGGDLREVECPNCRNTFQHIPRKIKGDPRNLAYDVHWDGWQPFSSTARGCGMQVNYAIPIGGIPPGPAIIRHLVLCCSGDHMGLCEVGKFIKCGKKACRRCDTTSVYLPAARHYYYTHNRYQARFPPDSKDILTEIELIREIAEEERVTVRERMSKECGYTGLSIMHRLWPLYGFRYDKDLVFDEMHTVQLNLVKDAVDYLLSDENHPIDWCEVDRRLTHFPWTAEFKASRLPQGITTRLGYWKAEDYSRFAWPASEVVLAGLLTSSQTEWWSCVARIEEFIQNHSRNGWTEADANIFHQIACRYIVLVEEAIGIQRCVISLHNLTHFREDIHRFSGLDNYACWVKERAVKRYIRQSNNHRNIEVTFANTETRREVLKARDSKERSLRADKVSLQKLWAKSFPQAKLFYSMNVNLRSQGHKGILVGGLQGYNIPRGIRQRVAECCSTEVCEVEEQGSCCRSFWLPEHGYSGMLYREKEHVVVVVPGDGEIVAIVDKIFTVTVSGHRKAFIKAMKFNWNGYSDSSDHRKVKETNYCVFAELENVSRKVMLQRAFTDPGSFLVIDFMRRLFPLTSQNVVLPYYPVVNDMVMVRGESFNDVWRARVISYNLPGKFLLGRFFVRENDIWIPERSSQNQKILFASILGIAQGIWSREFDQWQED